jgi:hypothetical protein
MDYVTAYLAGMVLINGMFALRSPHEDLRTVFVLAVFWPVSILAILFMILITATGWDFDVDTNAGKMFNYRKPTNPEVKGFGLCLVGIEFQVYKKLK